MLLSFLLHVQCRKANTTEVRNILYGGGIISLVLPILYCNNTTPGGIM